MQREAPSASDVQRAAGDALDALGDPPRHGGQGTAPLLKPEQALAAVLAAGIAELGMSDQDRAAERRALEQSLRAGERSLSCTFELLAPARTAVPLQVPMPSWCAWLVARGVLHWETEPQLDPTKTRLLQRFSLSVLRAGRLQRFALDFSAPLSRAARPQLFVALSPSSPANDWQGPVCVRVAMSPARRFSLGPPAHPDAPRAASGSGTLTWVIPSEARKSPPLVGPCGDGHSWPLGWPQWLTIRGEPEGNKPPPTALLWLPALWHRRHQQRPEPGGRDARLDRGSTLSLGIDIGSRTTGVTARTEGGGQVLDQLDLPSELPLHSGFSLLLGDAKEAWRFGCGEELELRDGYLPTALHVGSAVALRSLLSAPLDDQAAFQAWLPQKPPAGSQAPLPAPRLELFKSPELLHHAEAMPDLLSVSDEAAARPDLAPAHASWALMHAYGRLLGHAIAALHASPGADPHAPDRNSWPHLDTVSVAMAYPRLRWGEGKTFAELYQSVGERLCEALRWCWAGVTGPLLVADPDAAKATASADIPEHERLQVLADFGGLTLQISCEISAQAGRAAALIPGTSMTYVLGGERWLEALAFALAGQQPDVRASYAGELRALRNLLSEGGALPPERAQALSGALFAKVSALIGRQVAGTLKRAALNSAGFRGTSARVLLLGDGWKLFAFGKPSEERESALRAEILKAATGWLRAAEITDVSVERRTKQDLCKGAIAASASAPAPPLSPLHLAGARLGPERLNWFATPDAAAQGRAELDTSDSWWTEELRGPVQPAALCTAEQWLLAHGGSRFGNRLRGTEASYDPRLALLEQFLRASGPSLIALEMFDLLRKA